MHFFAGISPHGTDIVRFWVVSTMSHYFPIFVTDLFADKQRNPSNITCNGIRLLPIQVSLVPSDCIFSSSAETDTKRRN